MEWELEDCIASPKKVPVVEPKQLPISDPDGRLRQLVEITRNELLGETRYHYTGYYGGSLGKQLKSEEKSRKKSPGNRLIPKPQRVISKQFLESVSRDIQQMLLEGQCDIRQSGIKTRRIVDKAISEEFGMKSHKEALEHNMKLSEEIQRRHEHAKQTIEDTLSDIQLGLVDNPVQAIRKLKTTRW